MNTVACPTCGARVEWCAESRWRPFCSERCKLLDLSGWMLEEYRIPAAGPEAPDDAQDETGHGAQDDAQDEPESYGS